LVNPLQNERGRGGQEEEKEEGGERGEKRGDSLG
jgi:hypothetical protein